MMLWRLAKFHLLLKGKGTQQIEWQIEYFSDSILSAIILHLLNACPRQKIDTKFLARKLGMRLEHMYYVLTPLSSITVFSQFR